MNYDIYFHRNNKKSINEFKNAMMYLYPDQINTISKICKIRKRLIKLDVCNNTVSINKSIEKNLSVNNYQLVDCINILKQVDDKSYIINFNDIFQLKNYKNNTNSFIDFSNDYSNDNHVLIIHKKYFFINNVYYQIFFNNINSYDYDTYIRINKLKNIL